MIVTKFGGSSLADAKHFAKVAEIVRADPERRVVVVSAPGKGDNAPSKVTDLLYLCHAHREHGVDSSSIWAEIYRRFDEIRKGCVPNFPLDEIFDELKSQLPRMTSEQLVSRGEYLNARLMADYLGFRFLDAALWVKLDYNGVPDPVASARALCTLVDGDEKLVIPGFYGSLPCGDIGVMSRGGSDITGALVAEALGATLYENWTDVSGVRAADPRIVEKPRYIERLTYDELAELSLLGASVLHPSAVEPVRRAGIPLQIRNTEKPDHPGTLIADRFSDQPRNGHGFLTGVTGRKGCSVLSARPKDGLSSCSVAGALLGVFEQRNLPVELLASGADSLSVALAVPPNDRDLLRAIDQLEQSGQFRQVTQGESVALIGVVGRNMASRPGICGQLFAALGDQQINIRMIAQGLSELSIVVAVAEPQYKAAIRALYDGFCAQD